MLWFKEFMVFPYFRLYVDFNLVVVITVKIELSITHKSDISKSCQLLSHYQCMRKVKPVCFIDVAASRKCARTLHTGHITKTHTHKHGTAGMKVHGEHSLANVLWMVS